MNLAERTYPGIPPKLAEHCQLANSIHGTRVNLASPSSLPYPATKNRRAHLPAVFLVPKEGAFGTASIVPLRKR
jgi:hypothetical protein